MLSSTKIKQLNLLDIGVINHKNALTHKIEWYITNLFFHGGNANHCHGIKWETFRIDRSGLPEEICKKFTEKHLCQSLFFNKVADAAQGQEIIKVVGTIEVVLSHMM